MISAPPEPCAPQDILAARVSVLMPVKNAAATLDAAIDSFLAQDWPAKELIIIDGASTDATADILARRRAEPAIRVFSGSDSSATEALAHGATLAEGAVIGLLMGDDWLEPGALSRVMAAFAAAPEAEIVSGGVRLADETGAGAAIEQIIPASAIGLTLDSILGTPYPAVFFFRARLWRALGGFWPRYRYAADRDLLMRCLLSNAAAIRVEETLYAYRKHAGSDTLVENDAIVRAFLADHLSMAAQWLKHPSLTAEQAHAIRAWRRGQAVELTLRHLRQRDAGAAAGVLAAQAARDPRVLGAFAARAARHAAIKARTAD